MKFYVVDAFARKLFEGNPANICLPDAWPSDALMQQIAFENNLSETAFAVPSTQEGVDYDLRWFTPVEEVPLCGHATLAAAHVICSQIDRSARRLTFSTQSGLLHVQKQGAMYELDFPVIPMSPIKPSALMIEVLGVQPRETWLARHLIFVLESDAQVRAVTPDLVRMKDIPEGVGCVVTAPGDDCDFVSRTFVPKRGVNEDPVNGTSHTSLVPYWAGRLGKRTLTARMRSRRGGTLHCTNMGDRVLLAGGAVLYAQGVLHLDRE